MRVELPAYSRPWLRGDKYGEVIQVAKRFVRGSRTKLVAVAYVRLDDSDEVVKVVRQHCTLLP